jgi:hypothetical protein
MSYRRNGLTSSRPRPASHLFHRRQSRVRFFFSPSARASTTLPGVVRRLRQPCTGASQRLRPRSRGGPHWARRPFHRWHHPERAVARHRPRPGLSAVPRAIPTRYPRGSDTHHGRGQRSRPGPRCRCQNLASHPGRGSRPDPVPRLDSHRRQRAPVDGRHHGIGQLVANRPRLGDEPLGPGTRRVPSGPGAKRQERRMCVGAKSDNCYLPAELLSPAACWVRRCWAATGKPAPRQCGAAAAIRGSAARSGHRS